MNARHSLRFRPTVNRLDERLLLSTLTPAQMSHAYGFDSFHFIYNGQSIRADGSGQTIALIEAYHDPKLFSDLNAFDAHYSLPSAQATQYWYGTQSNDGWAGEEALDVEWAHALAPGAKLVIVEARSSSFSDLLTAINFARNQPGVSVVSMSFGQTEFSGENSFDGYFTTPAGHTGITFVASTGDHGAWPGQSYPAVSPNVLAVGGTTLRVDSSGNYLGETGWNNNNGWATDGGYSTVEGEPSYQYGVQRSGRRTTPDVSMDADPNTGCSVYFTTPSTGQSSWYSYGGTSASAPMWAALIAIADQGHAFGGRGSLDGASQTLPAIYSPQMTADFHDITQGFNGYYAGYGYDLVTGRGTPMAFNVVRDLMQVGVFSQSWSPSLGIAGSAQVALSAGVSPRIGPTLATTTDLTRLAAESILQTTIVPIAQVGIDSIPSQPLSPSFEVTGSKRRHEVHDLGLESILNDCDFFPSA